MTTPTHPTTHPTTPFAPIATTGTLTSMEPLHPEEVAERHRQIMAMNEERARIKRAEVNRAHGLPAPNVGDKLFVTTARGVLRRRRANLDFGPKAKREVLVVDDGPLELRRRQDTGESITDVDGAEQILGDDSLLVHTDGIGPGTDLTEATTRNIQLESENAELRAQLAAARRGAGPDPGDGSSSRLKAAEKAREATAQEFGGRPPTVPPPISKR